MAKIANITHHLGAAAAADGVTADAKTPSLVEAAHTAPAMPQRSQVTDSDATRVDTAQNRRPAPSGESFGEKLQGTLAPFAEDLGIDIYPK